jgi:predicted transcriptional regulator
MEYLLIVGLTFVVSWSIIKISNKKRGKFLSKIRYRQSNIYEMVKDVIPKEMFDKPKVITQSQKHVQKNMLKVVITDDMAYWTVDNVFYTANSINGRIDESTIKPIDMYSMSKKELKKMMDILDDLNKGVGPNDSSSAGDDRI